MNHRLYPEANPTYRNTLGLSNDFTLGDDTPAITVTEVLDINGSVWTLTNRIRFQACAWCPLYTVRFVVKALVIMGQAKGVLYDVFSL